MLPHLAKDIMSEDVVFVYEGWSIKRLATFLSEHEITGAPVVAPDQSLVGVVSTSDIFQFANLNHDERIQALRNHYQQAFNDDFNQEDLEKWSEHAEENCTVGQIMNREVIAVPDTASFSEVCAVFLKNGIHRVFVTKDGLIKGVITTTNIFSVIVDQGEAEAA